MSERVEKGRVYRGEYGRHTKWYEWTGEVRAPRKGEFYLSGAIVTGYRALGDLSNPYHIAREIAQELCPCCKRPLA